MSRVTRFRVGLSVGCGIVGLGQTAWRVAHQACQGGIPGFLGYELIAQGVIGPGAQQRLMNGAMQYACPVQ
jgi:hypothetical protein